MKRDWDCIRAILVALEDKGDPTSYVQPKDVAGFDDVTVSYNIQLMMERDLIRGTCMRGQDLHCIAKSMTWEGHEFLDRIRAEGIWNKVKAMAREQGVSLCFDLIKFL